MGRVGRRGGRVCWRRVVRSVEEGEREGGRKGEGELRRSR